MSEEGQACSPAGFRHFILVTNVPYDFDDNGGGSAHQRFADSLFKQSPIPRISEYGVWYAQNFGWMLSLRRNPLNFFLGNFDATDTRIRLRVQREYQNETNENEPLYVFSSRGMGAVNNDPRQAQKDLEKIRIVPNPYYAYSQYENSQVDKRVKITNLPSKCTISIFSVSGSLVRQFKRDVAEDIPGQGLGSIDWELTNGDGLPVSSGIYIVHVDGGDLGEKVIKFFNIARPIDLDSF